MRIDTMHTMPLDTPDHPIHGSHDVAYALVDPAETEAEAERRQGVKAATATTVRPGGLSLGIQLADYMAAINR